MRPALAFANVARVRTFKSRHHPSRYVENSEEPVSRNDGTSRDAVKLVHALKKGRVPWTPELVALVRRVRIPADDSRREAAHSMRKTVRHATRRWRQNGYVPAPPGVHPVVVVPRSAANAALRPALRYTGVAVSPQTRRNFVNGYASAGNNEGNGALSPTWNNNNNAWNGEGGTRRTRTRRRCRRR